MFCRCQYIVVCYGMYGVFRLLWNVWGVPFVMECMGCSVCYGMYGVFRLLWNVWCVPLVMECMVCSVFQQMDSDPNTLEDYRMYVDV
jgi:EamA domain-containing membrane protein RarD